MEPLHFQCHLQMVEQLRRPIPSRDNRTLAVRNPGRPFLSMLHMRGGSAYHTRKTDFLGAQRGIKKLRTTRNSEKVSGGLSRLPSRVGDPSQEGRWARIEAPFGGAQA